MLLEGVIIETRSRGGDTWGTSMRASRVSAVTYSTSPSLSTERLKLRGKHEVDHDVSSGGSGPYVVVPRLNSLRKLLAHSPLNIVP